MSTAIKSVYNPAPVTPMRGEGIWLYEADGTQWLDCIGGVATNALGHCHPALFKALGRQASMLWHVFNALVIDGQRRLTALTAACFANRVFFANTGGEAVECAIKTARWFHAQNGRPNRIDIVSFTGSFHARSYAAINASGMPAILTASDLCCRATPMRRTMTPKGSRRRLHGQRLPPSSSNPFQGEGGALALQFAEALSKRPGRPIR